MKKTTAISIRSSAAEYLTFVAATGDNPQSIEMRYEDENIWLTQKMLAILYDVDVRTINEHLQKIFDDKELEANASTIRKYRIVQTEGSRQVEREIAKSFAESEFEKYRIIQDNVFESDYDKFLRLENEVKQLKND